MALTLNPSCRTSCVQPRSLFLLIGSHVFDEQSDWIRRRIGDPATISSVYLRGGTVFIVVAVWLVSAHPDRGLRAAGGSLGRRRGQPHRHLPVVLSGSCRRAANRGVGSASVRTPGPQVWKTDSVPGLSPSSVRPTRASTTGGPDLRRDRPDRLGHERHRRGRRPRRRSDPHRVWPTTSARPAVTSSRSPSPRSRTTTPGSFRPRRPRRSPRPRSSRSSGRTATTRRCRATAAPARTRSRRRHRWRAEDPGKPMTPRCVRQTQELPAGDHRHTTCR